MFELRVNEIFGPTFQGEGVYAGRKVVVVRLAGCDFRCRWCDTTYSLRAQHGKLMEVAKIIRRITRLAQPPLLQPDAAVSVLLTGGNPLLQPAVAELIDRSPRRWAFHVETQGSVFQEWVNHPAVTCVTLSPKLSSSGVEQDPETIVQFLLKTRVPSVRAVLKMVVFCAEDIEEAITRYGGMSLGVADWVLQVGTLPSDTTEDLLERWRFLTEVVMGDNRLGPVRILPQLHVLLYGHKKGV